MGRPVAARGRTRLARDGRRLGLAKLPQKLGKPEGSLVLLQWPGYSHPSFAGDYERETGCKITRRDVSSSADMVELMRRGPYDLVSASGDVSR